MDLSRGYGRSDTVLKILPSALFLLFLYFEMYDPLTIEYKVGWTEFFLLALIISYPMGALFQQFVVTLREICLKNTKYSNEALIRKYLRCDLAGFWTKYIKFYSEASPRLITMVESENLNKFFYLNMTFVSIMSMIVHVCLTRRIFHYLPLAQLILIVVFIKYHFQCQRYYFYVLDKATNPRKRLTKKTLNILLPPKPPKLK